MEQFKEQRDITEVLLLYLRSRDLWAAQTSVGTCFGYYKSLPLHHLKSISGFHDDLKHF